MSAPPVDPQNAFAHVSRGDALNLHRGRQEEALAAYDRAVELDLTLAVAHLGRGEVLTRMNRYEEALAEYERAIELDTALVRAYSGKGMTLGFQHKHAEALAFFERAIQLEPGNPTIYMSKGLLLLTLKQWAKGLGTCGYALLLLVKAIFRRFFWPARRS